MRTKTHYTAYYTVSISMFLYNHTNKHIFFVWNMQQVLHTFMTQIYQVGWIHSLFGKHQIWRFGSFIFFPSVAINTTHVMNSLMHRGDWHRMSSDQTQWVSHDGGMFNEWFAENTRWCHFPPCCYCEATTPNSPHGECDFHGLVSLSSYVYPTGGVFYDKMTFCD